MKPDAPTTPEQSGPAVASCDGLGHSWFSYDPGDGFEIHATEAEARSRAEKVLEFYRGEAAEGWDEEVVGVCWGAGNAEG